MKRISLLLFILLLPVFAVAGFYGYLWWRVTDSADRAVAQASPFMEISYDGVRIDLLATEVALQDLRVAPMGMGDQMRIEEVVLKSQDWSQMMRLDGNLQHEPWPEGLSLRLDGMLFHLDGPMMQQWTALALQAQPQPSYTFGRFCSSLQGAELMQAMGYRMINLDMAMGYQFNPGTQRMTIDMEVDAKQLSDFSFQMVFEASDSTLTAAAMSGAAALQSVSMDARDKGFNRRYREYCATQAGVQDEQFDAALGEEFIQLGQLIGLRPPETVVQHVVGMYRPGANLGFKLQPAHPVGQFDMAGLDSPEAFIELLNPSLNINGQQITAPQIGEFLQEAMVAVAVPEPEPEAQVLIEPQIERTEPIEPEVVAEKATAVPQVAKAQAYQTPVTPPVKGYRATPLSDMAQHVGKPVRMVTYFGRRIEGRILEINRHQVMIEQRMQRGVATYSIARDKVAELEVYR
ncbi:hypothetical protein [Pontibacterium sp.]|uniref:hypothetical protein n=1 Tax=Pontibacterium sp. TaxID=2036026 RepID=UPI003518125A